MTASTVGACPCCAQSVPVTRTGLVYVHRVARQRSPRSGTRSVARGRARGRSPKVLGDRGAGTALPAPMATAMAVRREGDQNNDDRQ